MEINITGESYTSYLLHKITNLSFFSRYKVESRIADAISKNKTLIKIGLKFQFTEVYDRVSKYLIENIDRRRKERVKNEGPSQVKWKPAKTLD